MLIFDLSHFGLLKITGPDAKKLLQGQLTCNLDELLPNNSLLGAHCNPQGRMLSLFQLFQYNDDYFLFMPQEMLAPALLALKKYAVFYKVTLEEESQFIRLGFIPETPNELFSDHAIAIQLGNNPERFLILATETVQPLQSIQAWKQFNIDNGLGFIYPETIARFLPHELNLDLLNGISFNKGCYTGQEIIARMHYRGKLKIRCHRGSVHLNAPPIIGSDILNEASEVIGTLVDFSYQSNQRYQILFIAPEEKLKQTLLLNESQLNL